MAIETPPLTAANAHHWYHAAATDVVTLQHGTSEASLASILKNGFQPMKTDFAGAIRDVLADYFPLAAITAELVQEVASHHRHSSLRDKQNSESRTIFACLAPSESAANYAKVAAAGGGEFAEEVHSILKYTLPDKVQEILGVRELPPRYEGARPVLIEFDASKSQLIGLPRLEIKAHERYHDSFAGLSQELTGQEISVRDAKTISIRSVTFGKRGADGSWTFVGQPALPPEQALGEIQAKFRKGAEPALSKFTGPRETASDLIKSIGLQAEEFIRERVTPQNMEQAAKKISDTLKRLADIEPGDAANIACSILNHPKLGALATIGAEAYTNAMGSFAKKDPESAQIYPNANMEVYGKIAAVAKVAAPIVAAMATHKSPPVSLARPGRKSSM